MEQKRSRTADFLKGVAIIAMVQLVLTEFFGSSALQNSTFGKISLFLGGVPVAPVFLSIMGYYIAHNKKSSKELVIRGVKLIVSGFFLNIARNIVPLYAVVTGASQHSALTYIFEVDILILAGLSVIAMAVLIKQFDGHVLLYIGVILILLFLQYIAPPVEKQFPGSLILPYFYGSYPGAYFPFIPWFSYVLAGFTFFHFKHFFIADNFKHNSKVKIILIFQSGLLFLISMPFGFNVSIHPRIFAHHGLMFFLFSVNFLFWWLLSASSIVKRVDNFITRYLEWTGKNVTLYYIVFMIIAGNLTVWYKEVDAYLWLILFVSIVFVTSVSVYVLKKVPPLKAK
jgi:uncharacterized membrane protein